MNRFLQKIFLLLIILSTAVGCTLKEEPAVYTIGFSQAMTTDNWRRGMNKSMQVEAQMHPEIDLVIKDAANDVKTQIAHIEAFIEEGVDVLIVSPIQSVPITPVIEKAMNAGIPTFVIDRKIEGRNYTAYLGADNFEIGANAARYLLSHSSGSTRVVEITGEPGSSPARERSLGFNSVIDSVAEVELVGRLNGDWEKSSITPKLSLLLDSITPPDYIFAHNDRMALGAWEIARSKSLADDLQIIGVDGLFGPSGGIQLVKEGILAATILYPTGGAEAIKLAKRLLDGENINKNNILRTVVIDPLNAGIMQNQFDKINQQQNDISQQQDIIKQQITTYRSQSNLIKILIGLFIVLFLFMLWSLYLVYKLKKSKRYLERNNRKIRAQHKQIEDFAQKLKASNESKINFFTALSHEFKTPLTLITSSIETIAKNKGNRLMDVQYETNLIINNSRRLLRLINELLDFRKLEGNTFELKPVRTDLSEFIEAIYQDFKNEARRKSIDLVLHSEAKSPVVFIDRDMMDKVFFNLLSNALKFTPKDGRITIRILETEQDLRIIITDSGMGIPREEYDRIFHPFTQASNNAKVSSGLGLFITKQFVELHKGSIKVSSGHGAEFQVRLLKGTDHLEGVSEAPEYIPAKHETFFSQEEPGPDSRPRTRAPEDAETILIIEDNMDLATLLDRKFSAKFQVILSDGTDGEEKALEHIPDLILCDINLPEKSGFRICSELKNDLRTSHIPTIILTALSDQDSRIKALKSGADLYITKPFNFEVLEQSIHSLLYNREKLHYYYTHRIDAVNEEKFVTSEQQFLKNLNKIIEENLENPKFSVEDLSRKMLISRVQLYRKIKALLGISISEYINGQRLNKARHLLQESDLNIAEIAYKLGYSSPGYFSTSFKNKFGSSPKQFRS